MGHLKLGKENWKITVNDDGEISIIKPQKINENTISSTDSFHVPEQTTLTTKQGDNVEIKNLAFKEGDAYIQSGETATVDSYKFPSTDNDVSIFLSEPDDRSGDYVFISDNGLEVGSTGAGEVKVEPQPGNKLFWMVKRDYSKDPPTLVPSKVDSLSITVSKGADVSVTSREKEGKTPLVDNHGETGDITIKTGRMGFGFRDGKEWIKPAKPFPKDDETPIPLGNSVALELKSGENVIRSSSSNRVVYLEEGNLRLRSSVGGLEVSDKIDTNMMKTVEDLKHKYPKLKFEIGDFPEFSYNEMTANLAQATDQWLDKWSGDEPGIEILITEPIIFHPFDEASGGFGDLGKVLQEVREKMAQKVMKNPEFQKIVLETKEKSLFRDDDNVDDLLSSNDPSKHVQLISTLNNNLWVGDKNLHSKFDKIIGRETGLYGYSFNIGETSSTYPEPTIEKARRNPELAQIRFDKIHRQDLVLPQRYIDEVTKHYWKVVGGPNSAYCKQNGCGACLRYKKECVPS